MTRVVVLRGGAANPWELRAWEQLGAPYEVEVLVPGANAYDTSLVQLEHVPVRTLGSLLPGPSVRVAGERYLGLRSRLEGAAIVHSAEIYPWFAVQPARLKRELGFRLVLTVWETLPFLDAYRNARTRAYRRDVLPAADLFLPTTRRAADALLLEGVDAARIEVSPPGIDIERFAAARTPNPPADGKHLLLSVGRLVWEKGHQDVIRALAWLRREGLPARLLIVGSGPEQGRLRAHADELGVGDRVELRGFVPYEELTGLYGQASCLVLASLGQWYWEEQFGMVLAEAMAAHLPIVASTSGAIPEVVGGSGELFAPGDWRGLADVLAAGPLAGEPAARRAPEPERLEHFSNAAAAARLQQAYDRVATT
ncbi:MAG TPA: glycosyltransferase family 4 protein [Solirubrobacteraceae bacterium]|nr:glycosyltransferase family 4 protein [Solirubrobacteraceae bacterium]